MCGDTNLCQPISPGTGHTAGRHSADTRADWAWAPLSVTLAVSVGTNDSLALQ